MRLNKLHLTNACLHEQLSIEFEDGLIGVFGPIGSGKSTAMNLAYAALTNDFSRITGGKEGAIRQGAADSDASKIVLEASHGGSDFTITRSLRPAKHRLVVDGGEPITKAGEIQEVLEGVLGADRRLMDEYVFVRQWGLRKLFENTEKERAVTLSHLCNTTHAEKCWEALGKRLDADSGMAAEVIDNSDEIRQEIGKVKASKRECETALLEHRAKLLTKAELKAGAKVARDYDKLQELEGTDIPEAIAFEQRCKAAAKEAVTAYKTAAATQVDLTRVRDERAEAAIDVGQQLKDYKQQLKEWNRAVKLHEEISRLDAKKFPQLACEEELSSDDLRGLMAENTAEMAGHQDFLGGLAELDRAESAECPTCHQSLEDVQKHIQAARDALRPLELVKQKLRKRFCLRKDWEDECKDVREAERRNQALRDSRQADLVAMGDVPKPRKIDEVALQGLVRAASDAVKALHTAVSLTEECLVTKTTKITRHKTAKAAVAKYSEEAAALTATQEDADEARDKLAQHRAAELEVHAKEALLETYDEQLETRQHELDRLERILERSENARHWVSVLQGARDVLHRGNLPRIVHHNALTRMESGINEILDQFEQPWYVTTADDLSYVAHFRNGTVMPASGLSGGQQVLLALAFRWVLNSLFASQIGMMVLDEPTAGLDERHLDLLEIALQKLGEQARSVGYQVIIITHQLTLERVIDQSIKLDRIIG